MKIRIDTWFDVTCDRCAKSRSSDYEKGMEMKKIIVSKKAYAEGWRCCNKETLCPECVSKQKGARR